MVLPIAARNVYTTPKRLEAHAKDCCHAQRIKFPKDPRCRFTNIQKQLPAPFVVYGDFESILKPVNEDVDVMQRVDTNNEYLSLSTVVLRTR